MPAPPFDWDYLVLTAAHARQAASFEAGLALRRDLGRLAHVRVARVIADFEDRRIGSGASTLDCLREILRVEAQGRALSWDDAESILRRLRVLIVHAGGDARRLPAYSAAGKIFLPLPGPNDSALPLTMFDLLVPRFLQLPSPLSGEGQVVVASGDALIDFDPAAVSFDAGITVLGSRASPREAARHGVFCADDNNALRLYLQKPTVEQQQAAHALDAGGQSVLDLGVMSLDAPAAVVLLRTFSELDASPAAGPPPWAPAARNAVLSHGLDLYREICAAFGADATLEHYLATAASAGSRIAPSLLQPWFARLHPLPVRVEVLDPCRFLHFGTTRQLIDSGLALLSSGQQETSPAPPPLVLNSQVAAVIEPESARGWIENCRISAPLTLGGDNVLTGIDVTSPLSLPPGACLDVTPGSDRRAPCWFVRCYGMDDDFKRPLSAAATFCGVPFADWLARTGANAADVWPADLPAHERTLWTARLFPAEDSPAYGRWLWMFDLASATPADEAAFLAADRYSCAEIARLADTESLRARRLDNHLANLQRDLPRLFSRASRFSAGNLAFLLARHPHPAALFANLEAFAQEALASAADPLAGFISARITHSLGSAIAGLPRETQQTLISAAQHDSGPAPAPDLPAALRARAFDTVTQVIVTSSLCPVEPPRSSLRPDERVWGRAPARIELGGGWTDTPPYTLEYGGHVTNTAIDLSGQPPIHCYARVIGDPVIRMHSTDSGRHLDISQLAELLDYRRPGDPFALAKAALAISGFSPAFAPWPQNISLAAMLDRFGGGLELTTLVGIPQGSGLGTSSILGAVVLAVVQRVLGRPRSQQQLFHDVLRLEQALTTGGGWQDQIGGCTPGTKITATAPGLFPEPHVEPLPSDLLDPVVNGGVTLLYYTGLTRLAKDILQEIVGAYLDREPRIMAALAEEHWVARAIAGALSRHDLPAFGRYVDAAWELQKRLCGTVTNPEIESLLRRVRPHVHGMRISGAGSGGFLLMICKSPADALRVRDLLQQQPLNPRSRFFDYSINRSGLQVTTC